MLTPPMPADEATRVDTLRALNILDSSPEERFDRLTRLAKRLFGVPIALVSLVDANRQWFKSCTGLDATETSREISFSPSTMASSTFAGFGSRCTRPCLWAAATPRDISFCGHAILGDDVFLIPDAALDERFHDNPLVVDEPRIRFYAGCPLKVANGSKLGTLCIIDRDPREFDEDDLALLRDLARMAEQELAAVQLATMDELTMISNRRGFTALGQHALGLCRRLGRPASLLYFDLDHFKPINDRFGHAEGDRALTSFAAMLKDTFRESDVVGRLGGDEFAVLLTDADASTQMKALARLADAVAKHNVESRRGYDIAYSVGAVAMELQRHATIEALMADADTVMYAHKRARRDADAAA